MPETEKPKLAPIPRLKPGDVAMSDSMPFGQHYEARTVHPLELCLGEKNEDGTCSNEDFFMNVRDRFRTGDRINLVRYNHNNGWESRAFDGHVLEVVEGLRVMHVDNAGVKMMMTFPIWKLNIPGEQGVVVGRGFAGKFVIRLNGEVRATKNTDVEANEYADMLGRETNQPVKHFWTKRRAA